MILNKMKHFSKDCSAIYRVSLMLYFNLNQVSLQNIKMRLKAMYLQEATELCKQLIFMG